MSTAAFQQGITFELERKRYTLLRKVEAGLWQAEEVRTKRIHEFPDEKLHRLYARGQLKFASERSLAEDSQPKLVELSGEQWEAAKIRRAYVMAVLDLPGTRVRLVPVIEETWRKLHRPTKCPNVATVMRWKRRFLEAGKDIRSLFQQDERKGNATARFPSDVLESVRQAIDTKYLCSERGTIEDVVEHAQGLIQRENRLRPEGMRLPLPTRRLVRRVVGEIPAFDRHAARYGHTAAVKKFRAVLGHRVSDEPLARAEMDHTLLDLMVIDEATNLPLGRPYLTVCIDDHTRCILGIFISFEPPSYFTVARCLKNAFLPKPAMREEFQSVMNEWCAYGIMRELVVDNGREFHSESLENACLSLGIEIHYAPRKRAWFKGKVERYFGTLNRTIAHKAPGTTFHNILERGDYDPSKHAVVTYRALKEIVCKWICDVYHQKPHRALHMSPASMWATSIAPENIMVPEQPEMLDAILGRSEERMLTHKGIELDRLFYNGVELQDLRKKYGATLDVDVRADAADLGHIIVLSPDKRQMFRVPAIDLGYASGLTHWQHQVIKRFAALELRKHDASGWIEAKAQIADMVAGEFRRTKLASRKKIARFMGEDRLLSAEEPASGERACHNKVRTIVPTLPASIETRPLSVDVTAEPIVAVPMVEPESTRPAERPKKAFKFTYRERASEPVDSEAEGVVIR